MDVKLVLANGKNVGQVIPLEGPKFMIGRADDCDLRPRSDVVSRYHCTILVEKSFVVVRDSGSKNGTFVNGEQVMGEQELNSGDRLRVGQLELDVLITGEASPTDQGKVEGVHDAARRTVEGLVGQVDLSDWLGKEDSSGTVLGILPLRRANSPGSGVPPETAEEPKGDEKGTEPPKN